MSVRFRRHYHLLLLFVAAVVVSGVALRNTRITAYTVAGGEIAQRATVNYDSRLDLFDATVVHEVVVLISDDDQKKMVTTYQLHPVCQRGQRPGIRRTTARPLRCDRLC